MLCSASKLAARATQGRDVDPILKGGSLAPKRRFGSSVALKRNLVMMENAVSQVKSRYVAERSRSVVQKNGPFSAQAGVRAYHATGAVEKKTVPNTKAMNTQGRRQREKTEEESASMKYTMKPGPGAGQKAEKPPTVEEQVKKIKETAAKAAASPTGLLLDQKTQLGKANAERGGNKLVMVEVLKKMKEEYPATFAMMRYQWMRMPPSMRAKVITDSQDFKSIYADPEMKPFVDWLERLEGRGVDVVNPVRKMMRRKIMAEKVRLAALWQETDAALAEMRAGADTIDALLPEEPIEEHELADADPGEPEQITKAVGVDGELMNDPEVQLVLNYMVFPRESIDPSGTLHEAVFPEHAAVDTEILSLAQSTSLLNDVLLGLKRNLEVEYPELVQGDLKSLLESSRKQPSPSDSKLHLQWMSRQTAAKNALAEAVKSGLTKTDDFVDAVEDFKQTHNVDWVPDPVAVRLLLDSAQKQVDSYLPEWRAVAEEIGPDAAAEMTLAHLEEDEAEDTDLVPEGEEEEDDIDSAEIHEEIFADIDEIDQEEFEEAFVPDYAALVIRELTEPVAGLQPQLSAAQRTALTEHYDSQLKAFLELDTSPSTSPLVSEEEVALQAAKTPEEQLAVMKRLLRIEDVGAHETMRLMLLEHLKVIGERAGLYNAEEEGIDQSIISITDRISAAIATGSVNLSGEQGERFAKLKELVQELKNPDMPEEERDALPVGNPFTQFDDAEMTLQMTKDMIVDQSDQLETMEDRFEGIFEKARELAHKMIEPGSKAAPIFADLERAFHSVYGSPVEDPTISVTSEDVFKVWTTQMKEDIVMMEARSAVQRERDSIIGMQQKQLQPLSRLERPETPYEQEVGLWPFSASDVHEELPPEQRIYVSSDLHIDEIFSDANVGKYLSLSPNDLKRHLPEGFSIPISKREFETTNSKSLLIRPQALDAIANLKAQLNNAFVIPKHAGAQNTNPLAASSSSSSSEASYVPKPMLLHGYRGCGKSAIMSQVVYWARRSGWLVVNVPDGYDALSSGVYLSKNTAEGTWDQPKLFSRFFGHLLSAHGDKLAQIKLKAPNVKLGKKDATTLFDVVEYGSVLETHASQCFTIFKNEIRKVVEFPVLLAFDSYNALYIPSRDFRDPESTTYHKQPLNPYNMTFGRLFFDAHLNHGLAYGTFLGGLTESVPIRDFVQYQPKIQRGRPLTQPNYLEVPPYSIQEFTTVMEHYKHTNWVRTSMRSGSASELYIYQITSGFGDAIWNFSRRL